jgi:hypothetical protein
MRTFVTKFEEGPDKEVEEVRPLGSLDVGETFRFSHINEAVARGNSGQNFLTRIKEDSDKPDKVTVVSIDGSIKRNCDKDHQVIVHKLIVCILPAKTQKAAMNRVMIENQRDED